MARSPGLRLVADPNGCQGDAPCGDAVPDYCEILLYDPAPPDSKRPQSQWA